MIRISITSFSTDPVNLIPNHSGSRNVQPDEAVAMNQGQSIQIDKRQLSQYATSSARINPTVADLKSLETVDDPLENHVVAEISHLRCYCDSKFLDLVRAFGEEYSSLEIAKSKRKRHESKSRCHFRHSGLESFS
jgi:hypothetical protein